MSLNFPWNNINEIKFNDGEILNSMTMNIHLKRIYDNAYYLNNDTLRINSASLTTTGVTQMATPAQIIAGTINNNAISTSAFNQVLSGINQTTNYSTASCIYLTDTIKILHGQIAVPPASTGTLTITYTSPFTTMLLNFSMYQTVTTSAGAHLANGCYRANGIDPLLGMNITYTNYSSNIASINWSAIGI